MKIDLRPLDSIRPYPGNPRKNAAAVEPVARSIAEFGFRQPIVVDGDGVIIVGHVRHAAAVHLGLDEVPVHVADDLSEAQARAYRLVDNTSAGNSTWDDQLLPIELSELQALDVDLSSLGFEPGRLEQLLADFDEQFTAAAEEIEGRLDQTNPPPQFTCPNCGHTFASP